MNVAASLRRHFPYFCGRKRIRVAALQPSAMERNGAECPEPEILDISQTLSSRPPDGRPAGVPGGSDLGPAEAEIATSALRASSQ